MTKYSATWVLVADASRARLFRRSGKAALAQLREWDHQASRAKNQELVSDRAGRINQSRASGSHPGHGSKSAMEPELSRKEVEQEHFARLLAGELVKGRGENAYGSLILVANPAFLGTLRQVLDEQVHKHIVASVDKDYTACTIKELEHHLASTVR